MSLWERITTMVVPATLILWILYDLVAIRKGGTGSSLSRKIREWSQRYWQLTLVLFYILGHLFWPQPELGGRTSYLEQEIVQLKEELRLLGNECNDRGSHGDIPTP